MKNFPKSIFVLLIILFIAAIFIVFLPGVKPIRLYTIGEISASAIFLVLCFFIKKYDFPWKYFAGFTIAFILIRIILISIHPIGSDDYYRYLWDGKVQMNGKNPYSYAPDDIALNSLHSDILPKLVNHPEMKTIYPPLSEILFFISYLIGGESFIGIKILILIFDLITIWGIFLILKKLKLPEKYLLIYIFCPLIIFQFFIDAHVDGFGLPFLIFSLYFYLDKKNNLSYILLGLSLCVKPLGLILVPIYFFSDKNFTERIKAAVIPVLIFGLSYVPYIFTGTPFKALMEFTENWTFNGVIFNILDSFIKDNQRTRLICAGLLAISYIGVLFTKKDILEKLYLSIFLLYIFSPVVHPWYLSWFVLLLPIVPRWSGIAYVSLISLTAFTVLNYQLHGIWKDYTPVLMIEYAPVLLLFTYEIFWGNARKQKLSINRAEN